MEIQSLSIDVPAGCLNNCKFCVSKVHPQGYENLIDQGKETDNFYIEEYIKRLNFARDNNCSIAMLTGTGEPLSNQKFLLQFAEWNKRLKSPFKWIELQTSGLFLTENYLKTLSYNVGVNTISLSLSDMFDSDRNAEYNGTPIGYQVYIKFLCNLILSHDFNLRLSLNMTDAYNNKSVDEIFDKAKSLGANQITFRKLYTTKDLKLEQNQWINKHSCKVEKLYEIESYIKDFGNPLEILPFGARKYSVQEMSVVLDDDCMSKNADRVLKYLILRPNCKLYSRWDDKGSLYF